MNAFSPPTRIPTNPQADELERSRFDCSPEHLAQVAASYPNFGTASPARKAYLAKREADREAAARAQVGWLTGGDADAAVHGLLSDAELLGLAKGQRKFAREERRTGGRS